MAVRHRRTVPVASDLPPIPDPRFSAGLGNRVALRTLAIDALPVSTLQETLLADLRILAAGPHLP